jgi:thioredoxin-dependent peroxiredoxin
MTENWVHQELPKVTLESSEGGAVRLPDDLRGKWSLLYFYPKDDTPGCTRQACSYRDNLDQFNRLGIKLYGISGDDLGSHGSFIKKFSLNFPLLSDTGNQLSKALGVYGEQEWKGVKSMGISRDTFLINPEGRIQQVWRKVSPDKTMEETLRAAEQYMSAAAS